MSEIALIGKKIGMTKEFYKTGQAIPVTVIKTEKGRIIQLIDKEKRGYQAVQVGFGKIKASKLNKATKGYFTKKNTEPKKILKEFRVKNLENYKEGNEFGLEVFKDIKFVDVRAKTIGKGFAGPMKRHNFSGLRATHGVSVSHRSHGSTGQRQDPGKVFKGKKMAGHMGDKVRTMQNLEIIKSDIDNSLLFREREVYHRFMEGKKQTMGVNEAENLQAEVELLTYLGIRRFMIKNKKQNRSLYHPLGTSHHKTNTLPPWCHRRNMDSPNHQRNKLPMVAESNHFPMQKL